MANSFNFFLVGLGEGGGRVASAFHSLGYQVAAINTALGDLSGLSIPEENKFLLKISQGGTGKDPLVVKNALVDPDTREQVRAFIGTLIDRIEDKSKLYFLLCVGGGGGSGSGLAEIMLDLFLDTGLPVGMIYTLPGRNEDVVSKKNAIETFQNIYNKKAVNSSMSPLIIVDNSLLDPGIPIADFYQYVNNKVAETIHTFNSFAEMPSKYFSAVDTLDLGRVLSVGGVCSLGKFDIQNSVDLAALEQKMNSSLFMSGMNVKTAKSAAIIVNAPATYLKNQNMSKAVNFLITRVSETVGGGPVFRGVYDTNEHDRVDVYVVFNGMTFPRERIDQLFQEVKTGITESKKKENRISEMSYDVSDDETFTTQSFQKIKSLPQPERKTKKVTACTNCRKHPFTGVSTNIYLDGGPTPFSSGYCPMCKGSGNVEVKE